MLLTYILYLWAPQQASATSYDCSTCTKTTQQFLLLPAEIASARVLAPTGGFANEHLTVRVGSVDAPGYGVPVTIAFAHNDTFYTHRLWAASPIPDDFAFVDAHCTANVTSAETWECRSWSISVRTDDDNSSPYTMPVSTAPWSQVVIAENMYAVVAGPIMLAAPALTPWTTTTNTSPLLATSRTSTISASPTSTWIYQDPLTTFTATSISVASSAKTSHAVIAILGGLVVHCLWLSVELWQ